MEEEGAYGIIEFFFFASFHFPLCCLFSFSYRICVRMFAFSAFCSYMVKKPVSRVSRGGCRLSGRGEGDNDMICAAGLSLYFRLCVSLARSPLLPLL
jgi:hypothetical protein